MASGDIGIGNGGGVPTGLSSESSLPSSRNEFRASCNGGSGSGWRYETAIYSVISWIMSGLVGKYEVAWVVVFTGVLESSGLGTVLCGFGGVAGRVKLNSAITSASGATAVVVILESGPHPSVLEGADESRFGSGSKGSGNGLELELELVPCSAGAWEVNDEIKGPSTTCSCCHSGSMALMT